MKKNINFKKLSLYASPEESPGYLLWRVSVKWRSSIEDVLKPLGLTHPQFVVLATTAWLTKDGEHTTQADVSRAAEIDPNTLSQIFVGLEKKGLAKRIRKLDERSKNPTITKAGQESLKRALPAVEKADEAFFKALKVKELKELLVVFTKLIQ